MSTPQPSVEELAESTDELRATLSRLLVAGQSIGVMVTRKLPEFQDQLIGLVAELEDDEVLAEVAALLRDRAPNLGSWLKQASTGPSAHTPEDFGPRLLLRYGLLIALRNRQLDLPTFLHNVYGGPGGLAQAFAAFRSQWLQPLFDDLKTLVLELNEGLAREPDRPLATHTCKLLSSP